MVFNSKGTRIRNSLEAALDRCVENAGLHAPPALRSTEREELMRGGKRIEERRITAVADLQVTLKANYN